VWFEVAPATAAAAAAAAAAAVSTAVAAPPLALIPAPREFSRVNDRRGPALSRQRAQA
jgi:hypothetical protein